MYVKKYISAFSICLIIAIFSAYFCTCEQLLKSTEYSINTERINGNLKIVLISDLHGRKFGIDNNLLVNAIKEERPDFIAITGDMVNSDDMQHNTALTLIQQLANISPVYYIHGNHENQYANKVALEKSLESKDVTILNNSMDYFTSDNGVEILVGGLAGFPYYEFDAPDYDNEERHFLDAFIKQQENNFSILLAHQPELYFWGLSEKNIDLMLCGHTHGGVVQLPFLGGVYAPNQGFFPEYDKGFFSSGTANMIITSGLGNTSSIPRINNEPEICIININ